jgi:hypothetical protein
MTINPPPKVVSRRGITLLELAISMSILLALIAILLVGTHAWKRGGDKATCILTQRNLQMATRCYQSLYGYSCGGRPTAENGTQDITRLMLNKGYIEQELFDQAQGMDHCPSNGTYACEHPDIFPEPGVPFITCSLAATDDHVPTLQANW